MSIAVRIPQFLVDALWAWHSPGKKFSRSKGPRLGACHDLERFVDGFIYRTHIFLIETKLF